MTLELGEIKVIRKKYGLTQSMLAKLANVSQSLIAKIEAGRIDPTYSNVKKISFALESLRKEKEKKAYDIMAERIVSVSSDELIVDAVGMMKKYEISQMPVIDNDKVVGFISESILLEAFVNKKNRNITVKEVMKDSPPVVSKNAEVSVVSHLLMYYPMVLVAEEGKLKGLITRSDVLRKAYKA